ncbi:Golgi apparatus protein 1 [Gryllus bimaculatus]|nr:Golgi apparatus protein 1 [Gryllus bimaculatus]
MFYLTIVLTLILQVFTANVFLVSTLMHPADARTPDYVQQQSDHNVNDNRSKRNPLPVTGLLIDEIDCHEDIRRLCDSLPPGSSDLYVLECIQSFKVAEVSAITEKCQHIIWRHIKHLIDDENLKAMTKNACGSDVNRINCPANANSILSCLIDNRDQIKSDTCRDLIHRIEWIAFSDFRIISQFSEGCKEDFEKTPCGNLQAKEALSQGRTLACLQQHVNELSKDCQKQVFHLSELQADDIKLDRQLYLACVEDHQKFCADVPRGSGKVYKCLMQHKLDRAMTKECQEHLSWRQKLIAQDYKVSRGLARACREDIRTYHCRRAVHDDKDIRLAQILLCLEGVIRNVCSLWYHANCKKRPFFSSLSILEVLVKQADAGEDWRVDPVLREACKPVVDSACQDTRGGDARVMTCLMEKLGSDHMTDFCETTLLQIQYFVARDFKLDPQLYRECRDDAARFCHAKRVWVDMDGQMDPERGPLVLPCLYRYAYHPDETMKIRRVMRQRAVSVDLQPEIEEVCLEDIAANCFEKTGKGEEMLCLQDKLDSLSHDCKMAVSNFTEAQAEHVELNPIIMSLCKKIMERHCEAELESDKDEGDIMDCLIEHKNEPDVRSNYKCRAAVEHFQLISLKNYHFTYKFKEACRPSVLRFCPSAKNKPDVIACLSEIMRNDTIKENKHNIPKECRQQLRAQLLQQRENIDLNPKLKAACDLDIRRFCDKTSKGSAQILECLQQQNKNLLSSSCHRMVFNVERQELQDSSVDYVLLTTCQQMIRQFCHQEDHLICLKRYKDETTFDPKCRTIVVRRMIEQSTDYRFNPLLQKGCKRDISKFCTEIVASEPTDSELNGKVIKCLKKKFRDRKLSLDCERQMTIILREAALNYKLNPLLESMCKKDIDNLCANYVESDGAGAVEECLKNAFYERRIEQKECQVEVASLIEEAKADIHVDPLLHEACSIDLSKYCYNIPQGSGRHIQCLQAKLSNQQLQPDCYKMLTKRMEMFKIAAKHGGSDLHHGTLLWTCYSEDIDDEKQVTSYLTEGEGVDVSYTVKALKKQFLRNMEGILAAHLLLKFIIQLSHATSVKICRKYDYQLYTF